MPQTTISQFQEGQQFDGDLLVKKLNFATTKSDKSYASIDFQDPTGVINGKMWDVTADDLDFAPADVVMVNAVVDSYHDKMQLNIKEIHKLADDDAFNKPEYYLAHAPINNESLKKYIQGQIDTVTTNNPEYGLLLDQLINHNEFSTNDFYTQPAASSLHHAFVGGLAYHVLRMCRHANALCQIYSGLNHDLLVTATIIHDVGKMRELSGYLATDYTQEGNLLGHITLGDEWIIKVCDKNGIDTDKQSIVLLRHCLLAHHGKLEYGSPVLARIPEAAALHSIDELDATMMTYEKTYADMEPGSMSKRIFNLDNQMVFKTNDEDVDLD